MNSDRRGSSMAIVFLSGFLLERGTRSYLQTLTLASMFRLKLQGMSPSAMNFSIISLTSSWQLTASVLWLTLVLSRQSSSSILSTSLNRNFIRILKAFFLLSSLNSLYISCDVLVIMQCCLKAAVLNHLLQQNQSMISLRFCSALSSQPSFSKWTPFSWLMCLSMKASMVSWISSPSFRSSHRMHFSAPPSCRSSWTIFDFSLQVDCLAASILLALLTTPRIQSLISAPVGLKLRNRYLFFFSLVALLSTSFFSSGVFMMLQFFRMMKTSLGSLKLGRMKLNDSMKYSISLTLLSISKNSKTSSKLDMTNVLNSFRKYLSLFSKFLQLRSFISSLREAALSFPISMKSYSLKTRKFFEYFIFLRNMSDSMIHCSTSKMYFLSCFLSLPSEILVYYPIFSASSNLSLFPCLSSTLLRNSRLWLSFLRMESSSFWMKGSSLIPIRMVSISLSSLLLTFHFDFSSSCSVMLQRSQNSSISLLGFSLTIICSSFFRGSFWLMHWMAKSRVVATSFFLLPSDYPPLKTPGQTTSPGLTYTSTFMMESVVSSMRESQRTWSISWPRYLSMGGMLSFLSSLSKKIQCADIYPFQLKTMMVWDVSDSCPFMVSFLELTTDTLSHTMNFPKCFLMRMISS